MVSYSTETILTSIFMITVSVLASIGNFLVILAILWNKRLRTMCNFLFLNLAVADMLQGAIAMPLRLADQLNQTERRPLIPCLAVIPLTVFLFGASNFNLTLISLDRYLALKKPFLYTSFAEPRKASFIVALFWVLIFIIAFLPIFGWGQADTADVTDICLFSTTLSRDYLFMLFSIVNLSVIITLAFTNYFILKTARSQIRRIQITQSHVTGIDGPSLVYKDEISATAVSGRPTSDCDTMNSDQSREKVPRAGGNRERRATKIVLIVVGIFVFLTTPITVIDIISLLGCPTCTPLTLIKITVFMAYSNACVNVFIYAGFNTEMRNTWICIYRQAKEAISSRFR
ncbi:D(2) dopamine receptor-like [Stylophora pistillata]|uniref:D(2) dopamine receptor-like n=1 Tax=Stylophora pistillata TaxID=50429 RepID=UPI000C04E9A3|nr:D(2) dopamine receptor-like [Stylophora pistillata]